ncbi:hypothetical protein H9Q69_014236 [Fusarium xylarioides]|uniref:Extracellular membrane protein CFEM domain-containing protein n=1 Tax=Fusarium xylarioides TaxID=221167 RepID=A0A9P7LAK1_9HYPO|nr:hypothetical protein H9Q70_003293 [Fusarium xylarioides]KAG5770724.1 hypothetical protein H9Q72_002513 [Fusarium xylarioides]KAG5782981.1 hypothetical protein H9Q73_003388 [Fusarium xylarioides]KAG5786686.1 hypothetical protein H9Q69_014236 [Fusarium xylarioides]
MTRLPNVLEKQNKDATCNNNCFFKYFTNKCNADNPACVCTLKDMREKFFCCIADNCAENVLPEQIERSSNNCDAHGISFTFDAEAVCGIKLPVSSKTVSVSVTMSEATTVTKAKAVTTTEAGTTAAMTTTTGSESSVASQTTSAAAATVTDNSASRAKGMVAAAAIAIGVFI